MKNFRFDTICNITQEPQELQRFNLYPLVYRQVCCETISPIAVKSYFKYQWVSIFRLVSSSFLLYLSLKYMYSISLSDNKSMPITIGLNICVTLSIACQCYFQCSCIAVRCCFQCKHIFFSVIFSDKLS